MSKRRRPGDLVWKGYDSGFVGQGGWGVIQGTRDAPAEDFDFEHWCVSECGDKDCVEWCTIFVYGTGTREEAQARIDAGEKPIGVAFHVNECGLYDDKGEDQDGSETAAS